MCVRARVCMCVVHLCVEVRGQLLGADFLMLTYRIQVSNSNAQACTRIPLPSELSHHPKASFCGLVYDTHKHTNKVVP